MEKKQIVRDVKVSKLRGRTEQLKKIDNWKVIKLDGERIDDTNNLITNLIERYIDIYICKRIRERCLLK